MLWTILGAIGAALAAFLIYAATRPSTFRYARSTRINAPAETIFPLINDYANWVRWSPYEHRDPAMKRGFSGPMAGRGAVYTWDGNKNVGSGRMEILDTAPPNQVLIKLDFFRPFKASNIAEFTLEPKGGATEVTWAMRGPVPYIGKIINLVINCDKMVGNDFATGLASMKAVAEQQTLQSSAA